MQFHRYLTKRRAYLAILGAGLALCLLYESFWIFSRTTNAEIYAVDGKTYRRSGIHWIYGSYQVDGQTYQGMYLKGGYGMDTRSYEIRYLLFAPGISRANSFVSSWGPLLMFFILWSLIVSIVFIRKDIIADQAIFLIQSRRPFVKIENNPIEDYNSQVIDSNVSSEAEKDFRSRLESESDLFQMNDIQASVYKFNPNAIAIFVAYVFLFFWSFYSLLKGSLGYPAILFLASVLIFVPLFVQNTNNPIFKAKIPDTGSVAFSSRGVQVKDDFYAAEDIDAAVVYLEAFRGFEYTERTTIGNSREISDGDNNKISFRYKGQVIDLVFILDQFADYWSFKSLMGEWAGKGINVLLEKAFEDNFMIQEMVKFNTPVSPGGDSESS
jgi:hypothetical protein